MKKFILLIISITVITLLVASYIFGDDEILPEAQVLFQKATQHKNSKAYEYLYGIQAALGEEPTIVGKKIVNDIEKVLKSNEVIDSNSFAKITYPKIKRLKLSKVPDNESLDMLFDQAHRPHPLSLEQIELLSRYQEAIAFNDFHTLFHNLSVPLPDYQYISQGSRLLNLKAIYAYNQGNIMLAETLLRENINSLRFQLGQSDSSLYKLVCARGISKSIDVLAVLNHKTKNQIQEPIKPLTLDERSFKKAITQEFAVNYNMLIEASFPGEDKKKKSKFSVWSEHFLYKPKMSINKSLAYYQKGIKKSLLNNQAFAEVEKMNLAVKVRSSFTRNHLGNTLVKLHLPNFDKYIALIFTLDAKIALYNESLKRSHNDDDLSQIKNPFYDNKPAYFAKNKTLLCIDAPLLKEDQYQDRCLRLKL